MLGNGHFNKGAGRDVLSLMMASAAFGNAPRAVLGFARDEDAEDGSRVISVVKNNLAREDFPSLKYTIEEVVVPTRLGPAPVGRLIMLGESDKHVRDILCERSDDDGSACLDKLLHSHGARRSGMAQHRVSRAVPNILWSR